MNQLDQTNYLDTLIENFINQPKFSGMNTEEKLSFKEALIQNYNDRITSVVILNMPQEFSNEFTLIAEKGDNNITQEFIYKYIPNFDLLVQNETIAFLQSLIATDRLQEN